jgi:hypothetical protein
VCAFAHPFYRRHFVVQWTHFRPHLRALLRDRPALANTRLLLARALRAAILSLLDSRGFEFRFGQPMCHENGAAHRKSTRLFPPEVGSPRICPITAPPISRSKLKLSIGQMGLAEKRTQEGRKELDERHSVH